MKEMTRALSLRQEGEIARARAILTDLTQVADTAAERALAQGELGNLLQSLGSHSEAIASYNFAAQLYCKCGDRQRAVQALVQSAVSHRHLGDLDTSEQLCRGLLNEPQGAKSKYHAMHGLMNTLSSKALRLLVEGQSDQAAKLAQEMRTMLGDTRGLPFLTRWQCRRLIRLQRHNLAALERRIKKRDRLNSI